MSELVNITRKSFLKIVGTGLTSLILGSLTGCYSKPREVLYDPELREVPRTKPKEDPEYFNPEKDQNELPAKETVDDIKASLGEWKRLSDPPYRFCEPLVGVIDNKLYVAGGSTFYPNDTDKLRSVFCYDPKTDKWSEATRFIDKDWRGNGIGVIDDQLYVLSSFWTDEKNKRINFGVYNPRKNLWTKKNSPPFFREDFTAGVLNDKLYVIGGSVLESTRFTNPTGYLPNTDVYDPKTDKWSTVADMMFGNPGGFYYDHHKKNYVESFSQPEGRIAMTASEIDNRLYVVGGIVYLMQPWVYAGKFYYVSVDEGASYDAQSNRWRSMPDMINARTNPGSGVINNRLYVIGGYKNAYPEISELTAEVYNPRTRKWKLLPKMPVPQKACSVGIVNNKLYSVGTDSLLVFTSELNK